MANMRYSVFIKEKMLEKEKQVQADDLIWMLNIDF